MSSKWVVSERMPSAPEAEDEWKDDDLEDFELVRPGGEPGASVANAVISL